MKHSITIPLQLGYNLVSFSAKSIAIFKISKYNRFTLFLRHFLFWKMFFQKWKNFHTTKDSKGGDAYFSYFVWKEAMLHMRSSRLENPKKKIIENTQENLLCILKLLLEILKLKFILKIIELLEK